MSLTNKILTSLGKLRDYWNPPLTPKQVLRKKELAEEDRLGQLIEQNICPHCAAPDELYVSAEGGISQNIYCGRCGHRYNYAMGSAEPIYPTLVNLEGKWQEPPYKQDES